jgi:hypothetical protein
LQTTIGGEDAADGSQQRRQKKKNGRGICFFGIEESGSEAAAAEKSNAQTSPED